MNKGSKETQVPRDHKEKLDQLDLRVSRVSQAQLDLLETLEPLAQKVRWDHRALQVLMVLALAMPVLMVVGTLWLLYQTLP